jgi:hypothetical protein
VPDLGELLSGFTRSAFRLETRQRYTVDEEANLFAAFQRGEPLPDWTADNNPWLKMVTDHRTAGRTMQRVHLVRPPLSDYLRFEFTAQLPSVRAGEDIRVADLQAHPELAELTTDFWLFDDQTILIVHYDPDGRPQETSTGYDPAPYRSQRDRALSVSVPMTDYLAALGS